MATAMGDTVTAAGFEDLAARRYVVLTTFRRTGERVETTVWLLGRDGKIYVSTSEHTGKVKRLRRDPRVRLRPSDAKGNRLGPAVEGRARLVEGERGREIDQALRRPYGWQKRCSTSSSGYGGRSSSSSRSNRREGSRGRCRSRTSFLRSSRS